jgi:hypothetical protein
MMIDNTHPGLGIDDLLKDKRDEILRLAQAHGAYNVRMFGSVARGEAGPNSDVDFLVEWDYARMSPWGGIGFNLALEELLGCRVDVVPEQSLHSRIKKRVLQEAIPL